MTLLPSSSIVRILKSIPIVVIKDGVKESSLNRRRQQDFPTPESPIRRSFIYTRENITPVSQDYPTLFITWGGEEGAIRYQEVIVS